jgi:hypothetical protein
MMRLDDEAFGEFAVAEHPQTIVLPIQKAFLPQRFHIHGVAILEDAIQVADIDNGIFPTPGGVTETPLGYAADHGHLTAFGKRMGFVGAGTATLSLVAARARFAVAGTNASPDPFLAFPPWHSYMNLR